MTAMQIPFTFRCNFGERACLSGVFMGRRTFPVKGMLFNRTTGLATNNGWLGNHRLGSAIWCSKFGPLSSENEGVQDDDGDYLNSTVLEAVEVRNGSDDLMVKMRDGRYLKCVYNQSRGSFMPDYLLHPAIVLQIENGSGLILPIIVLEMPSILLMAALRNIEMVRPTVYNIIKHMIEKMGYMVKFARVTKRVEEAYFAELCLVKVGDEANTFCFDIRPSDAINIAVRCKAPIQVNKHLVYSDGLKIVETTSTSLRPPRSGSSLSLQMDRPDGQPCPETEEFVLVQNMLIAAFEERYSDAAQWKDMLNHFRSKRRESL